MPRVPTVNDSLWWHFTRGDGLACQIRKTLHTSRFLSELGDFFDATDDHSRLFYGTRLATLFLRRHNLDYLVPLWDLVRRLEYERVTVYGRQTDHTAHSVYLYLLGVWFFDHSAHIRRMYTTHHLSGKSKHLCENRFSIQWLLASLLHDVGYVFGGLHGNSVATSSAYLKALDQMLDLSSLGRIFPYASDAALKSVAKKARPSIKAWHNTGEFPVYANVESPADVLRELDKVPWLRSLGRGLPISVCQAFDHWANKGYKPTGARLKAYAEHIAVYGYKVVGTSTVDHAYASGTLLFQMISLKYWLILECGTDHLDELSATKDPRRFPGFTYEVAALRNSVLPACHAAAAHNVLPLPGTNTFDSMLPMRADDSPLLFLSILCDELQKWHRAPIGHEFARRLNSYDPPFESEVWIDDGGRYDDYTPGIGYSKARKYRKIFKQVHARLCQDDVARFVSFRNSGDTIPISRKRPMNPIL